MERELKSVPPPPAAVTLAPGAEVGSWLVIPAAGGESQRFASVAEAAAHVAALGAVTTLCLPAATCVLQRVALPSTDATEVREMALLQVEKVLPYGLEAAEVAVSTILTDAESTEVAAVAASREQIDQSAAPLTERQNWPFRVLTNAQRIAARAPAEGTAALFFEEHGEPHLVVAEKGIATFTQPLIGRDVESLAGELPGVLLAAELAGVRMPFAAVLVDERWKGLAPALAQETSAPAETVNFDAVAAGESGGDLQPASWKNAIEATAKRLQFRRVLLMAAACYVALLALGWMYAGWLKYQVASLDGKSAKRAPRVSDLTATMQKWNALSPATDQRLYLLEMLMQVCESRPSRDLYITAFDQSTREILVQGEAPSAAIATDLNERLKAALPDRKFSAEPPQLLASGRARFRISVSLTL